METFLKKHRDSITGVLSCPDRVIFKGYLGLNDPGAVEAFLGRRGVLLKDFKWFARAQSDAIKDHAMEIAKQAGRPYVYLNSYKDKDALVKSILARDNVAEGVGLRPLHAGSISQL